MQEFFSMTTLGSSEWPAANAASDFDEIELWDLIDNLQQEKQWRGLELRLEPGTPPDFLATDIISLVCSPRLVGVLQPFGCGALWLPVTLRQGENIFNYSFLHFAGLSDLLDESNTTYAGGRVAVPCISRSKAADRPMFCLEPNAPLLYVNAEVKRAIEEAQCTNVEFEKARSV